MRDRLAAELAEQREARLQHMREQMRDRLADESVEQREVRLQQMSDSVKEWLLRLSSYGITFSYLSIPIVSTLSIYYPPETPHYIHLFIQLDSFTICTFMYIIITTSIKNNCLKLKNEVGMEVLKSKQTRVVYRDNQHIRIVYTSLRLLSYRLVRLCDTTIYFYSPIQLRLYSLSKRRDVLYVCADYLYILLLFVCFLALPSLLHFSILSNCFLYLSLFIFLMILDHSF